MAQTLKQVPFTITPMKVQLAEKRCRSVVGSDNISMLDQIPDEAVNQTNISIDIRNWNKMVDMIFRLESAISSVSDELVPSIENNIG